MSGKSLVVVIPPVRPGGEAYTRVLWQPAVVSELRKEIRHIQKHINKAQDAVYHLDRMRPAVSNRLNTIRKLLFEISRNIRDLEG